MVLPGDVPLLRSATLLALYHAHHNSGATATLLTSVVDDPTGYGRVIREGDAVVRVVEHKDATAQERTIREIATGVYAFDATALRDAIRRLTNANAQGEQYLPDVVELLARNGAAVSALTAPQHETAGVNDRIQLAAAHRAFNTRLLEQHMREGVTVIDPASTWVDVCVRLAPDVTLLPGSDLRGRTTVADGAVIGPQTTLVDTSVGPRSTIERAVCRSSKVGADVTIGPFAYLRPGTELADRVHIGTYVEVKASDVGTGSKIPHLSYIGDATIGEHSNIGAATVFVNYDGVAKHHSTIGDHVRTGADNMFVAPVSVGDGAYTAAGSVINEDVPPGALAVARARQRNVAGWVLRRRPGTPAADAAARASESSTAPDTDGTGSP
jgi:bifunctional UDP-N-acetylglucosamine pyrophosphorylase/glucosamine-1-phosphate N-acetyltransferase